MRLRAEFIAASRLLSAIRENRPDLPISAAALTGARRRSGDRSSCRDDTGLMAAHTAVVYRQQPKLGAMPSAGYASRMSSRSLAINLVFATAIIGFA